MLLDTVRELDDATIVIEDIALHRPTLDDVFLSLTGHAAEMALEEAEEAEPEPEKTRSGGEIDERRRFVAARRSGRARCCRSSTAWSSPGGT